MSDEANVFDRALARFRRKGWWKGGYTGPDGEVCAIQGLIEAGASSMDQDKFLRLVNEEYPRKGLGTWTSIPDWNDTDAAKNGATASRVVAVTRKAAEQRHQGVL